MKRLDASALASLPGHVARPNYDRDRCGIGIVHLGIGAFHRAHQACYTDDVLGHHGGDWRITGVSLRSGDVAGQLNPQDGLYTLNVKDSGDSSYRVIGAIDSVLVAPDDPLAVVERMADPAVHVVSLTVTEKGYCHDPSSGQLQRDHPAVRAEIEDPTSPRTAPGFLVAAIEQRRSRGQECFTVLCCDNLPDNGRMLRNIVVQHAALRDDALAAWIEDKVAFPATMIDRIVPATTDADREEAAQALGVEDHGLVVTEPFTQWVIEDRFGGPRPAWEDAGARIVPEVAPFELAKLRMLNGSHSTIAYLGFLAGYDYVHEAMRDPALRRFVERLMCDEIAPTLEAPAGLDLDDYRRALLERFSNPGLNHRTWQIAMDGSQKLPQRLLGTARERLERGQPIPRIALAIAAWIRYVHRIDESGRAIDVQDPLQERLASLTEDLMQEPERTVDRVLDLREVFDEELAGNETFRTSVITALRRLVSGGSRQAIADFD